MTTTSDLDPVIARAPGGVLIDHTQGKFGVATATFDAGRIYRYRLSRVWDPTGPRVNFVMLNPSTADAFLLDPTVRRCVGFAQSWGGGALEVTNIFALRSTDPGALRSHPDPVGVGNDDAIIQAALAADLVVAAWGTHAVLRDRGRHVRDLLAAAQVPVHHLRLTKAGHPAHPLYLPASAPLTPWVL